MLVEGTLTLSFQIPKKTRESLAHFEAEFNQFLVKHFQTGLYVAFGWSPFSANDMTTTLADYRKVYQTTSRMISQKEKFLVMMPKLSLNSTKEEKVPRENVLFAIQ